MPVNLSIKNVPDCVVQRLRERAERHHRSLTPAEVLAEVRRLGLQTPGEAVALVRADRDVRKVVDASARQ